MFVCCFLQWVGGSAAQSSAVPAFDAALGVEHTPKEGRIRASSLLRMNEWMNKRTNEWTNEQIIFYQKLCLRLIILC